MSIPKTVNNILGPNGLKLLTRLKLELSHLNDQKLTPNFKECVHLLCSCSLEVESVSYFSCTVIISQILEKPSLMNYNQLMTIFEWNYFFMLAISFSSNRSVSY